MVVAALLVLSRSLRIRSFVRSFVLFAWFSTRHEAKMGSSQSQAASIKKKRKTTRCENKEVKKTVPVPLPLPHDVCMEIAKHITEYDALAFVMTCKGFRDAWKESLRRRSGNTESTERIMLTTRVGTTKVVSEDWIRWAFSMKWDYRRDKRYDDRFWLEVEKQSVLVGLAARWGFQDMLIWLKSKGCALGDEACSNAALGGHLQLLQFLKGEGVEFTWEHCNSAISGGHLDVLKYLDRKGVECDFTAVHSAASNGHVDILKYLKSRGHSFDNSSVIYASQAGQLGALKYLKSEGLSLHHSATSHGAAFGGHLDILKYLKSEGVSFDAETCKTAARGGHRETLIWLMSEACPEVSEGFLRAI